MMNRIALESFASGRRASVGSHLRGGSGKITSGDADDGLDLFSRTRRSDGDQLRLAKIAVGPARIKGMEDLLDSEIGKHDYDWLLTPPETPLYPCAVARESPLSSTAPLARESPLSSTITSAREGTLSSTAPRDRTTIRSVSTSRPSKLSATQTGNGHSTRPVRSSSVTRSSSFTNNNRTSVLNTSSASVTSSRPSTSVLNTSSASVTSSRPSTPSNRPTTARSSVTSTTTRPSSASISTRPSASTTARPSSASVASRTSRPATSRLPTPTRTRPTSTTSSIRPNNSRPSTPTSSRPPTPPNPNPNPISRASSRPATPTRRPTSSSGTRFPSTNTRISSTNTRNPSAPSSRPSSPGPRARAPVRPIDLPDFPVDAPPNLRTKLPERPASAGRARPGMALTMSRANSNSDAAVPSVTASLNRRNYAPPVLSRGRFPENLPKATVKLHGNNGHEVVATVESGLRRPAKSVSTTESTGFGRNISKKSLDMALRHMDIRQGMGGIRTSSLFPQSIRSTPTKPRSARKSDPHESAAENHSFNGTVSPDCRSSIALSENGDLAPGSTKSPDRDSTTTRDSELGSSRYDAFMLREEDSRNMNWLHSVEDKSDQSPVFDHRFEPLPEPFGLL